MPLHMPDAEKSAKARLLIATVTQYVESTGTGIATALLNSRFIDVYFGSEGLRDVDWSANLEVPTFTDGPLSSTHPFLMYETPLVLLAERRSGLWYAPDWGFVPQTKLPAVKPFLDAQAKTPARIAG